MKRIGLILSLLVSFWNKSHAQSDSITDLLKNSESEIESESIRSDHANEDYTKFDALEQYTRSPLLLNRSSRDELEAFPFLNEIQITALLRHKEQFGDLIAIEELQTVNGFDDELIRSIKPLISIGKLGGQKPITPRNLIKDGSSSIILRVQKALIPVEGESDYSGSNEKLYLRYRYQLSDRIRFGFTAEKDPGEYFFNNSRIKGFDFYSGHLIFKSKSIVRQVTLGDYTLQHGQGIVMWSGMGFGKSSEVMNIQKNAGGVRPHTSVDENNFFRGGCLTMQHKNWKSDVFISSHKKDGNGIETDGFEEITSLQTSGYHRTQGELNDRGNLSETVGGLLLNRTKGALTIGGITCITRYSKALNAGTSMYNKFEFSGKENYNYGLHYKYLYKNISTFGEIGMSRNGSTGFLWGSMIHLHPKLSYALLLRHFDRGYQAIHASAFSENTKVANESGIFSALQIRLPKAMMLSIYADIFHFPWLKYMVDAPSSGYDFLAILKWKPKRTFESYILFKTKRKEKNASETAGYFRAIQPNRLNSLRWNVRVKLNETWEWGSRVEHSMFKNGDQNNRFGFLMFQDILFHPLNSPISIGLRYAIFETDGYDTRIYTYENDVLFSYSVPAFQGHGDRLYLNMRVRFGSMLDLWLRYSSTAYNRDADDNYNSETSGEAKKEIKAQIRLRF